MPAEWDLLSLGYLSRFLTIWNELTSKLTFNGKIGLKIQSTLLDNIIEK